MRNSPSVLDTLATICKHVHELLQFNDTYNFQHEKREFNSMTQAES